MSRMKSYREKDVEGLKLALRVIYTWASFQSGRCLEPKQVCRLADSALKPFDESKPKPKKGEA